LYGGCRAAYYAPLNEDYGYVTVEAFLSGKPVVTTTDAGGVLEFVTAGETGLVAAPEPEAIAEAIDSVWSAPVVRLREMGEAGGGGEARGRPRPVPPRQLSGARLRVPRGARAAWSRRPPRLEPAPPGPARDGRARRRVLVPPRDAEGLRGDGDLRRTAGGARAGGHAPARPLPPQRARPGRQPGRGGAERADGAARAPPPARTARPPPAAPSLPSPRSAAEPRGQPARSRASPRRLHRHRARSVHGGQAPGRGRAGGGPAPRGPSASPA